MSALPLAHLGHWSGLLAFAVPGALTLIWVMWGSWRARRRNRFSEYWTLSRREGRWTVVAIELDRAAGDRRIRSPWSSSAVAEQSPGVAAQEGGGGAPPERERDPAIG